MNRFAAVPVLALVLAVACDDGTAPDRDQRQVGGPLFEQSPPGPSDRECGPLPLPPGTYQNVIVPKGQTCTISNSRITGNITVDSGSRLFSTSNTVEGNIQAVKARRVDIDFGSVGGGISIVDGPGDAISGIFPFDYDIRGVTVTRDIFLSKNRGFIFVTQVMVPTGNITAVENVIDPNAQLNINGSRVGEGIHVLKNRGGAIHVEGNLPPDLPFPITGKGNVKIEDNDIPAGRLFRIQFNRTAQNLQVFKNNVAGSMNVSLNTVGENLQVFTNTGGGSKIVNNNTAGESIQCKENTLPFVSVLNTAPKEEDQCPMIP